MPDAHKNFAISNIVTAPSPATSGGSCVVVTGEAARYPATPFNAVICPANADPTPANAEVVRVTNISTDTLTITRAQEGSSARTVLVGDRIYAAITAKTIDDGDNAPQCRVSQSTQNVTNNTNNNLAFDTTDYDRNTDTAQADLPNDQMVCRVAGQYLVVFTGVFAASSAGDRIIRIAQPKGTSIKSVGSKPLTTATFVHAVEIVDVIDLVVNDTVGAIAFQNSGGTIALTLAQLTWRRLGAS